MEVLSVETHSVNSESL